MLNRTFLLHFFKLFGLQFHSSTRSLLVCIKQCICGHSFTDVLMKFIDWVSNQIQDFTSNEHKLEILDQEPHQTSLSQIYTVTIWIKSYAQSLPLPPCYAAATGTQIEMSQNKLTSFVIFFVCVLCVLVVLPLFIKSWKSVSAISQWHTNSYRCGWV